MYETYQSRLPTERCLNEWRAATHATTEWMKWNVNYNNETVFDSCDFDFSFYFKFKKNFFFSFYFSFHFTQFFNSNWTFYFNSTPASSTVINRIHTIRVNVTLYPTTTTLWLYSIPIPISIPKLYTSYSILSKPNVSVINSLGLLL